MEDGMKRFLIYANADKDKKLNLSNKIVKYFQEHGASAVIVSDLEKDYDGEGQYIKASYLSEAEAVIVLGGDGTMLRAARVMGANQLPMIGINLGTLGFLSEVEKGNVYQALDRLMADDYKLEKRMMIKGYVKGKEFYSLNDIVITRAGFSRIIGLSLLVNEQALDTYEADGVIVATPTGSTGYSLSAGGPIVSPKSNLIIVTPISPHSLTAKSVVFDGSDKIKIEIVKQRKTQATEAIVSFDGDNSIELSAGDTVYVESADREVMLIKMYDVNFYSVLRDKIGG
ncbi:MAG: NAD(+)/NADH kinase [Wujia sp.]